MDEPRGDSPGSDNGSRPPQAGQGGPQQQPQYGQYGGQPPQYGQYAPPPQPQYGQYGPPPPPQYGQQPQYGAGPQGSYGRPMFQLAPKPGVIPLRPLNLGDIFGGTFGTIRGNPGAIIGLSALMALIVAVPSVLVTIAFSNADLTVTDSNGTTTNLGGQLGLIVSSVFSWFAGVLLAGMLTVVVAEAVLGRRISIGQTWHKVRGRLLPLIGLTLMIIATIAVAGAIAVGIVALLAATTGTVGAVIAAILLGVGLTVCVIWLSTKISLAAPALVLERVGPIKSIVRSWHLSRQQWWRIFGITLLAQLIIYVISQVVSFPAALIAVAGSGDGGLSVTGAVALQLVSVIVSALTTPFTAGVTALLYLDQRIRKEALDVTLMEAAARDSAKDGGGAR
ncbi:hypothetical protein [Flexivirga alba]|uniref:DUF7847 domain-containing protein n=1 Tax=Flexivirga alba TaxID=702742 RepID=A0ABW2ALZ6_9MICO